jgi:hypothetical protein
MMTSTFNFTVCGDSYEELVEKTEEILTNFLAGDTSSKIDYELTINPNTEANESEQDYCALVVARIKTSR